MTKKTKEKKPLVTTKALHRNNVSIILIEIIHYTPQFPTGIPQTLIIKLIDNLERVEGKIIQYILIWNSRRGIPKNLIIQ